MHSGFTVGRRTGWSPLHVGSYVAYQTVKQGPVSRQLTTGKVFTNHRDEKRVVLQPRRGHWQGTRVVHLPQFQTDAGYTDLVGPMEAKESVRYEALVLHVELLTAGELVHSSCRSRMEREAGGC